MGHAVATQLQRSLQRTVHTLGTHTFPQFSGILGGFRRLSDDQTIGNAAYELAKLCLQSYRNAQEAGPGLERGHQQERPARGSFSYLSLGAPPAAPPSSALGHFQFIEWWHMDGLRSQTNAEYLEFLRRMVLRTLGCLHRDSA